MIKIKKGFTLVELLVVIAIIGLLSTMAVIALNSARSKGRDATRVSDIRQVMSALELYYDDNSGYPVAATWALMDPIIDDEMPTVPSNPSPSGTAYTYVGTATTYTMTFTLENDTGALSAGLRTATPSGIQ